MNLDILPIRPADLPAIAALAREIWQSAYVGILSPAQIDTMLAERYAQAQLQDDLHHPQKWLYQAFVEGERVGFACAELCKGEFKLDKLYIHPDAQRQGIGGALIAHVAAQAKALGYPAMILAVNKRNEQALRAYAKHGFVVRDSVKVGIGGGFVMDDFIMEKKL
ncbi:MAG: GNAT family N-acetyltransferase [Zoogloeaceae bacterium]|nr:GNAT family N-acetyltransferase [Zoogloeaceae bacterium]